MDAIGKVIGLLVLVMFAVDCIVSAARSTLAWERVRKLQKNAHVLFRDKVRAQSRQAMLLNALTAVLCLAAVHYAKLRISDAVKTDSLPESMDILLTWIVLVAGIDRSRELLARFKGVVEAAPARKEVPAARIVIDNENHARTLREAV